MPDHGRDRVLLDATRRQSTTESHLTANSWSLSGMIEGLGWSEKRDAWSRDAWHSGRHRRMMNNNNDRDGRGHAMTTTWYHTNLFIESKQIQ